MISHFTEALTYHSSNNKVGGFFGFFFAFFLTLQDWEKKNAGGEFNPWVGICGCLDIYMALAVAVCVFRVTSCPRGL